MRRSLPLLSALAERLIAPSAEPFLVSAKVAAAASQRTPALSRLPPEIAAAVDAAAADANRKAVRQRGRQLTDGLKRMSRTKHRGGVHPNFHDEPTARGIERAMRGKRRQQERRALADLTHHGPLAIAEDEGDDEVSQKYWDGGEAAATGLVAAVTAEAASGAAAAAAAGGALYGEEEALAYAVTRLPACYAALARALSEAAAAAPPGWRPRSMLDFGAGPGTAAWAAHAVWAAPGQPPLQVTAVEPSGAMAWLGQDIQRRLAEAAAPGAAAGAASGASEEGGRVEGEAELIEDGGLGPDAAPPPAVRWMSRLARSRDRGGQRQRGRDLYASPGRRYDVVVAGYVLGEVPTPRERRRLVADLWSRTDRFLVLVEPGTPSGAAAVQAARVQVLTQEGPRSGGAHVAAPCPHDGPCPLAGLQSWCHFAQRFERPAAQRRAKIVAGKLPPRSHQDERFSYVILARGPRPSPPPQVAVAGAPPPEAPGADTEYLSIPEGLQPRRLGGAGGGERGGLSGEEEEDSDDWENSSEAEEEEDGGDSWEEGSADDEEEEKEGTGGEEVAAEMRRLLLESLGAEEGDELPPELEEMVRRTAEEAAARRGGTGASSDGDSERGSIAAGYSESSSDEGEEWSGVAAAAPGDPGAEGPAAVAAATAASASWSRLLRPPRKRSGHVVLDLCSAVDAEGRPLGGARGALLRQIVSRGKAERAAGGAMPYKLARKARWGDVWPADLQAKMGTFEPPAGLDDGDGAAVPDAP